MSAKNNCWRRTSMATTLMMMTLSMLLLVGCLDLVQSSPASAPLLDSTKCLNNRHLIFGSVDHFVDSMCTQCLDYLIDEDMYNVWTNLSRVLDWRLNITTNRVNMFIDKYGMRMNYVLSYKKMANYNGNISQHHILGEFANDFYRKTFLGCCESSFRCCLRMMQQPTTTTTTNHNNNNSRSSPKCPMKWDGWQCWDEAAAGTTVQQTCPDSAMVLFGFMPSECVRGMGVKRCEANGQWHRVEIAPGQWQEHTDYFECSFLGKNNRLSQVYLLISFEVLSLLATVASVVILVHYKLYTKFRVQIHLNFFASIILSSLMTLIYNVLVTKAHLDDTNSYVYNNSGACKFFTFMYKNARLVNYCWMLIEGVNFHHMVAFMFNIRHDLVTYWLPIYLLGWAFPQVVMIIYAIVRETRPGHAEDRCWTDDIGALEFIYAMPVILCFVMNFLLYFNLIRVIIRKLVFRNKNQHWRYILQGVKTSLVLMPIFGYQFVINFIPVDFAYDCQTSKVFLDFLQTILEASQGFLVSIALCFLNKDVHSCIRKSMKHFEFSTTTNQTKSTSAQHLAEEESSSEKYSYSSEKY